MICAIRHVGLVVSNLDAALEFWCGVMGFVVSRQMDEEGPHIDAMMGLEDVRVTTVKLKAPDGNLLELLAFKSHLDQGKWNGKPFSTGLTHIAFTVGDLENAYCRLQKEGVSFSAPPQLSPDGSVKVTYARGPENIIIELVEVL